MLDLLAPGVAVVALVAVFVLVMAVPFIATGAQSSSAAFLRAATIAGTVSYAAAVVAYTVLPLPSAESMQRRCATADGGAGIQLTPFHFLSQLGGDQASGGWVLLGDPALWQVVLNVALFVPLGILLSQLVPLRPWAVMAVAVACSLTIEVTQGTGLWFIYDCAYRVFDVDDMLANSLGAAIGLVFAGRRPSAGHPPH
ncbi:MAG: VanZ family protein [Ornithinimicrobium sp.]